MVDCHPGRKQPTVVPVFRRRCGSVGQRLGARAHDQAIESAPDWTISSTYPFSDSSDDFDPPRLGGYQLGPKSTPVSQKTRLGEGDRHSRANRQSPCPLWSLADIDAPSVDVRFAPESGHPSAPRRRPLCATSGHPAELPVIMVTATATTSAAGRRASAVPPTLSLNRSTSTTSCVNFSN